MLNLRLIWNVVFSLILFCCLSTRGCNLDPDIINDIAHYDFQTKRIFDLFTTGDFKGKTWNLLTNIVDKFGQRLSGSKNLENTIDYLMQLANDSGLDNVHTEDVQVPHWVRGDEVASLLKPQKKNLKILGFGGSVPTPLGGITADVIVVESFDQFDMMPYNLVKGKIVVFAQPYRGYKKTVQYRVQGASKAAKKGAVAALVRSITPTSIGSPLTGNQVYEEGVEKIPVAALTLEDADDLLKMQHENQSISIHLDMFSTQSNETSRNLIAEFSGYKNPQKKVVVSGHLDSWDVGDGALDGANTLIPLMATLGLKKVGQQPQRTVRTVLWTGKQQGLIGAKSFIKAHKDMNHNLIFVMESAQGAFSPLGMKFSVGDDALCTINEIMKLFEPYNMSLLNRSDIGSEIGLWTKQGIPGGVMINSQEDDYYKFHNSVGDTMDVLDSDALDKVAAFYATISFTMAHIIDDLVRT